MTWNVQMNAFISGIWLSFSLLVAIGAQNAFVLRQGLKQEYVFVVCTICAVSDAILIAMGVSGFYLLVQETPWIEIVARDIGALFLVGYGIRSFWLAARSSEYLEPSTDKTTSLALIVGACLAFTWLNPHVYLDVIFLLGSISTHYSDSRLSFALGAMSASFVFFFSLGYGARMLTPIFKNPNSWKILEGIIGIMMCILAVSLFLE